MKKILMILAVVGVMLFVGCGEKQITAEPEPEPTEQIDFGEDPDYPMSGTTWMGRYFFGEDRWREDYLKFGKTQVIHTVTNSHPTTYPSLSRNYTDTLAYTYDNSIVWRDAGEWGAIELGTIENDEMLFYVWETFDIRRSTTLTKQ